MAQNIGTLVSAAIRPNDSLDPIASAYASEIMGGLHSSSTTSDRDSIIFERREWGMMCYVKNQDKTYQLKYGYASANIMDNSNWVEFSGSGGGSGNEWIDSVLEVKYMEPTVPNNGDRYIVGLKMGDFVSGANWGTYSPGYVAQWNSLLNKWDLTVPTDGMSVRVDNEDNSIYRYEGIFPTGTWEKEKTGQVRDLDLISPNGLSYSATTEPPFDSYSKDMIFLARFSTANIGNMSIDINSMGSKFVKKPTPSGLTMLNPNDVVPGVVYSLVYDGSQFQLNIPHDDLLGIKYYIETSDYIVVPQYYQYWVYSDLTIDGTLVNYGQVIIANGGMIMGASGSFQNFGQLIFVNLNTGVTTSFYDTNTIQFTQSNTIFGLSVSAIVKDNSLTASKLDTGLNGGATAGYFLSVDNNGDFKWSEISTSASNGLSIMNDEIVLGGTLSQSTQIVGDGNDLVVGGVDLLLFTSSIFDVEADFVSIDAGIGTMQILADNDISIYTNGQLGLMGNSGLVTIDNGEGLVYSNDYSGTFVTNSLITKGYVDSITFTGGTGSIIGATNGLSEFSSGVIGLGGTLSQDTTISASSLNLTIQDFDILSLTGSLVDVQLDNGLFLVDAGLGGSIDLYGGDVTIFATTGIDFMSTDFNLSVGTGSVTTSNLQGLVYTSDYSGTFVTNSLVNKGYVDALFSNSGAQPEYSQRYVSPNVTNSLNFQPTGITISYTPNDYSNVQVILNGQVQYLGDGINSTASGVECYFSSDGGITAKNIFNVIVGDELYWNGFNSGFSLETTDKFMILYEK